MPPFTAPRIEPHDTTLDEVQREAVARALHTPDICLIQGPAGTGKSGVVTEIIRQATERGERVLFLAPSPAALDRVLQQTGGLDGVYAVRCAAAPEDVNTLSPCVRRLTTAERVRHFHEHTLPAAHAGLEAARQRLDGLRGAEAAWQRLDELVEQRQRVAAELHTLTARREELDAASDQEFAREAVTAVEQKTREQVELLESRLAALRTELEKQTRDLQEAESELAKLSPVAEARRAGQWWSASWWRALGKGDITGRFDELRKNCEDLHALGERLARDRAELEEERKKADESCAAECARLRTEERNRRRAEVDAQLAGQRQELQKLEEGWLSTTGSLGKGAPVAFDAAALATARTVRTAALQDAETEWGRTRQWADGLDSARDALPERIARCANVVAATTTALAADPLFGDKAPPSSFDLLVLEDAEQVTESEFVHVARRARRWVLVGEPTVDPDAPDALPRRGTAGKPLRPAALRPGFFQRLWRLLHPDPRRLPYSWIKRDGRLVCRLRTVPAEQQAWIETEAVADRPEIELRIVSPPRQLPQLAEVVFPAAMSIHQAKEYIFRELGEVPLQAHGPAARWVEEPDRIQLHLGPAPDPDAVPVELAPGMRELVGSLSPADRTETASVPWHTCGLAFDREAGWTLERARQWVEEHFKMRDLGRTAFLGVCYRTRPALARILADLFGADDVAGRPGLAAANSDGPCLEFVAIPAQPSEAEPRRRADSEPRWQGGGTATVAPRLRATRGGAGLEVDLADPRRLDPLPADLRPGLPTYGFANFLEAQAVVRCLETLVADPTLYPRAVVVRSRTSAPPRPTRPLSPWWPLTRHRSN